MFSPTIELYLSPAEAEVLLRPIEGEPPGGFQALAEALQEQLKDGGRKLRLDDEQCGRTIRLMTKYGSGGFQGRLQEALTRPFINLITRR